MYNQVRVCDFMSRDSGVQKMAKSQVGRLVAYPENDVRDLVKIMSDIKIDCVPVFSSPWNKKLVGFIEMNKVRVLLND